MTLDITKIKEGLAVPTTDENRCNQHAVFREQLRQMLVAWDNLWRLYTNSKRQNHELRNGLIGVAQTCTECAAAAMRAARNDDFFPTDDDD